MPLTTAEYNQLGNDLITQFLEEVKSDLIYLLDTENRNASGRARKSLNVVVSNLRGQILATDYIEYVFRGRGPGKMPPLSSIIDWCNARGLPRGLAWVIAKRIATSGTKLYQQGINYLDLAMDQKKIDNFIELIKDDFVVALNKDIISYYK